MSPYHSTVGMYGLNFCTLTIVGMYSVDSVYSMRSIYRMYGMYSMYDVLSYLVPSTQYLVPGTQYQAPRMLSILLYEVKFNGFRPRVSILKQVVAKQNKTKDVCGKTDQL